MEGHVNLRTARLLVALVAVVLVGALATMMHCSRLDDRPQGEGEVAAGASQAQEDDAEAEDDPTGSADEESASAADERPEAGGTAQDGAVSDAGSEDGNPEPEPEPVSPPALAAGDTLTAAEVERAGGADAFFWAEPIPDAVFARMEGRSFGPDCTVSRDSLRYVRVLHVDAHDTITVGELVVHRNVASDLLDIFRQLYDAHYPIHKMHLVDDYGASDDASCADDNTSCFNYRLVAGGSTLSNHAYGIAIDINTFENPYCIPSQGYVSPTEAARYADRSLREPYMIHTDDLCYQLFIAHGWSWGGDWPTPKDYQHFEKPGAQWE